MKGFKLRVPEVDTFRAMAEAWGARADADQLQRALSRAEPGRGRRAGESAADDPERASSTRCRNILVLTGHIITPRL